MNLLLRYQKFGVFFGLVALLGLFSCLGNDEPELPTLLETLESQSKYSGYLELSNAAGRTGDLDGNLLYTLFVPTNEALDSFKVRHGITDFAELSDTTLSRLVWYHRQFGKIRTGDMNQGYYTSPSPSLLQAPISILFNISGGNVVLNETGQLIRTNTEAHDGIIHEIDEMLDLPTVYDILNQIGDFTIFLEAAEKGGLTNLFKEEVGITVFAAPDPIWQDFFDNEPGVDDLDDYTANQLEDMIQYHMLRQYHPSTSFQNLNFPTDFPTRLAGNPIQVFEGLQSLVLNDSIGVILLDIQGMNGVIHFIDDVLEVE